MECSRTVEEQSAALFMGAKKKRGPYKKRNVHGVENTSANTKRAERAPSGDSVVHGLSTVANTDEKKPSKKRRRKLVPKPQVQQEMNMFIQEVQYVPMKNENNIKNSDKNNINSFDVLTSTAQHENNIKNSDENNINSFDVLTSTAQQELLSHQVIIDDIDHTKNVDDYNADGDAVNVAINNTLLPLPVKKEKTVLQKLQEVIFAPWAGVVPRMSTSRLDGIASHGLPRVLGFVCSPYTTDQHLLVEGTMIKSKFKDQFTFVTDASDVDITRIMHHLNPEIVHFGGSIVNDDGKSRISLKVVNSTTDWIDIEKAPEVLINAVLQASYQTSNSNLQCIVLSSCDGGYIAKSLIDAGICQYAVCFDSAVHPKARNAFITGFYDILSDGGVCDYRYAFEKGRYEMNRCGYVEGNSADFYIGLVDNTHQWSYIVHGQPLLLESTEAKKWHTEYVEGLDAKDYEFLNAQEESRQKYDNIYRQTLRDYHKYQRELLTKHHTITNTIKS